MGAEMAHGGSRIRHAEPIQQSEHPAIESSKRESSASQTNLAGIFPQGDIAPVMQAVFDPPVRLLERQQARGMRLLSGQIGQAIDGFLPLLVALSDVSM